MSADEALEWILTEECVFIKQKNLRGEPAGILAIRITHSTEIITPDTCLMRLVHTEEGWKMTFDGEYIPTESFMGFVGIFDMFDDADYEILHHPADA